MTACTAISAFFPSIVSKSIFAPRRADKSIESDNAAAGILNAGIATMQLSKLGQGVAALSNGGSFGNTFKGLASTGSIFSDINKVTNQLTKHVSINGFIGLAALANALSAEDKEQALIENGSMYGGMLAFEGAHKYICGTTKTKDGKVEEIEGAYRKSEYLSNKVDNFKAFCGKQEEALKESGEVKKYIGKMMKYVPAGMKGLSFAAASIGGSLLLFNVAKSLTGNNKAKEISISENSNNNTNENNGLKSYAAAA